MSVSIQLEGAGVADTADVLKLLGQHQLPLDGLADHLATTIVAKAGGEIVGTVALEMYAEGALLRSLAVGPGQQGQGLGRRLTEAALERARALGVPAVYLLTTTAEGYFPRFGFERIDRSAVPDSVRGSVEFAWACPTSAVVMRKPL